MRDVILMLLIICCFTCSFAQEGTGKAEEDSTSVIKDNYIALNLGALFPVGRFGDYPGPQHFGAEQGGLSASVDAAVYNDHGWGVGVQMGYYHFSWEIRLPVSGTYPTNLSGSSSQWTGASFSAGLTYSYTIEEFFQIKPFLYGSLNYLRKGTYTAGWSENPFIHNYSMAPEENGVYPGLKLGAKIMIKNPGNFFFAVTPQYRLVLNKQNSTFAYWKYDTRSGETVTYEEGRISESIPFHFFSLQAGIGVFL